MNLTTLEAYHEEDKDNKYREPDEIIQDCCLEKNSGTAEVQSLQDLDEELEGSVQVDYNLSPVTVLVIVLWMKK